MASEAERRPQGVFECQLCALSAPYSYVGQKPPNTRSVVLLEESYVLKDPFTADRDKFLVLGSRCSVCSRLVCVGPECSLFYTKRFCLPCVWENIDAFPQEIRQDVDKRKALARTPLRQAQFSDLRAARGQVGSPCTELWGTAAARARMLLSWRPWCLASFLGCVYSRGS